MEETVNNTNVTENSGVPAVTPTMNDQIAPVEPEAQKGKGILIAAGMGMVAGTVYLVRKLYKKHEEKQDAKLMRMIDAAIADRMGCCGETAPEDGWANFAEEPLSEEETTE